MRYRCVRDLAPQYPVTVLCAVLAVPRSGYYAWQRAPESARAQANGHLLVLIKEVHTDSQQTYGSPRVYAALRQRGFRCGRHRVARLMHVHGVVVQHPRRFRVTTDSQHGLPVAAMCSTGNSRPPISIRSG